MRLFVAPARLRSGGKDVISVSQLSAGGQCLYQGLEVPNPSIWFLLESFTTLGNIPCVPVAAREAAGVLGGGTEYGMAWEAVPSPRNSGEHAVHQALPMCVYCRDTKRSAAPVWSIRAHMVRGFCLGSSAASQRRGCDACRKKKNITRCKLAEDLFGQI